MLQNAVFCDDILKKPSALPLDPTGGLLRPPDPRIIFLLFDFFPVPCLLTFTDSRQTDDTEPPAKKVRMDAKDSSTAVAPQGETTSSTREGSEKKAEPQPSTSAAADAVEATAKAEKDDSNMYICQYCDREFPSSKLLISHEMQHLIGNHFEVGCGFACLFFILKKVMIYVLMPVFFLLVYLWYLIPSLTYIIKFFY